MSSADGCLAPESGDDGLPLRREEINQKLEESSSRDLSATDSILLSRLSLSGAVGSDTPLIVITEIADAHGISPAG